MTIPTHDRRRARGWRPLAALIGAAALVAGLAAPAAAATRPATVPRPAAGGAATRTCPAAPARPKPSGAYGLDGQRWDPADRIGWYLDVADVARAARPERLADIERALADAAAETDFDFVYRGEESAPRTDPAYFTLQFTYVTSFSGTHAGSLGDQSSEYLEGGRIEQTVIGQVNLLASLGTGYGGYDAASPTRSPEGDVLLHEVGAVLGLANVSKSLPEVMSSEATTAHYYSRYQPGDAYGLWRLGAAAGCSGFTE